MKKSKKSTMSSGQDTIATHPNDIVASVSPEKLWEKNPYTTVLIDLLLLLYVVVIIQFVFTSVKALCFDDLICFSTYHGGSFWDFIWNTNAYKIRPISNFFLALGLKLSKGGGIDVSVYLVIFNYVAGIIIYSAAKEIGKNRYTALAAGVLYLTSRFAYYQTYQYLGIMECCSLIMAILALRYMYRMLTDETDSRRDFLLASLFSLLAVYSHERFLCLLGVLLVAVLMKQPRKNKERLLYLGISLLLIVGSIGIRLVLFDVPFAGTGGTDMASSVNVPQVIGFFICGIACLFGFNAGPEYLYGIQSNTVLMQYPLFFVLSVVFAIAALTTIILAFIRIIRYQDRQKKWQELKVLFLIICFICGTLAFSCTTIRLEMRWLYAPYAGFLLLLAYCYRILSAPRTVDSPDSKMSRYIVSGLLAVLLFAMIPTDVFYRVHFNNMYFAPIQATYNQLYDLSIEKYGVDLYTKPIVFLEEDTAGLVYEEELDNFFYQYSVELFDEENRPDVQCYYVHSLKEVPVDVLKRRPYVFEVRLSGPLYPSINNISIVHEVPQSEVDTVCDELQMENLGTNIQEGVLDNQFYGWENDNQYIHMAQSGTVTMKTGTEHTLKLSAVVQEMNLPNILRLYFNGQLITEEPVTSPSLSLTVQSDLIPVDTAGELKIELEHATSDHQANGGADIRIIGMTIYDLQFQ